MGMINIVIGKTTKIKNLIKNKQISNNIYFLKGLNKELDDIIKTIELQIFSKDLKQETGNHWWNKNSDLKSLNEANK